MNADDKKLLRKFINQRADRTRVALNAAARRQEAEATRDRKFSELDKDQVSAVDEWNTALKTLADAANGLRTRGLDFAASSWYYRNGRGTKDFPLATSESFQEKLILEDVPLLDIYKDKAVELIRKKLNEAIARLDRTVDDALLDMLSADLPGIKETLAALSTAFDSVGSEFGITDQDYSS